MTESSTSLELKNAGFCSPTAARNDENRLRIQALTIAQENTDDDAEGNVVEPPAQAWKIEHESAEAFRVDVEGLAAG